MKINRTHNWPIPRRGDERHRQTAIKLCRPHIIDLEDAIERTEETARVGRAASPDAVEIDAALVQAVRHAEAEVLVDLQNIRYYE